MYIVVLRMMFSSLSYNTRALRTQLLYIRDVNTQIDPHQTPVFEKYNMLKYVCNRGWLLAVHLLELESIVHT